MITLTTPAQVNSILGGNAPIGYDKFIVSPVILHPIDKRVEGNLRITSTSAPDMPAITGSLTINLNTAVLEVLVPQLDFYQRKPLSGAQVAAVQGWINSAQNSVESGLISISVIAGTQTTGV